MDDNDIEERLSELGAGWPVASVAEAVAKRIEMHSRTPTRAPGINPERRFAWSAIVATASLTILLFVWFGGGVSRPVHALDGIEEKFRQIRSLYVKGTSYQSFEVNGKEVIETFPLEGYAERPSRYYRTWYGVEHDANGVRVRTGCSVADGVRTLSVSNNDLLAIEGTSDLLATELKVESCLQDKWMREIIEGPTSDYRLVGTDEVQGRDALKYECVTHHRDAKSRRIIWINGTTGMPVRSGVYEVNSAGVEKPSVIYDTIVVNSPPLAGMFSFEPPEGYRLEKQDEPTSDFEVCSGQSGNHRTAQRHAFSIDRLAILACWHHSSVVGDVNADTVVPEAELLGLGGVRKCNLHQVRTQSENGQLWRWSLAIPIDRRPINSDEALRLSFKFPMGGSSLGSYPLQLEDERLKNVIMRLRELGKEVGERQPDVTLVRLRWLAAKYLTQATESDLPRDNSK